MLRASVLFGLAALVVFPAQGGDKKAAFEVSPPPEALEQYRRRFATSRQSSTPGSLFTPDSYVTDLARDPRASRTGDLVTVIVAERASALTTGQLSQTRDSDTTSSIGKLFGILGPTRPLPNLLDQNSSSTLTGQGTTSRRTDVTATLTAAVVEVAPNGNLIIEGVKEVVVNADRQTVFVRGVVRPADLLADNSIPSERVALLDLRVNGRGAVQEAIRRPNIIYRVFRQLLPF